MSKHPTTSSHSVPTRVVNCDERDARIAELEAEKTEQYKSDKAYEEKLILDNVRLAAERDEQQAARQAETKRADEARAELAALNGRRCKECAKFRPQHDEMPTDYCLDIGYVCFNDFACNRWEARP